VGAGDKGCPGCRAPLLYGLIAPPQSDRRIQERAAAALTAIPGGPGLVEARRRVREGLPLIVGLSRARTEQLQGELVDRGLLPRLGPAPRGTAPLEPQRESRSLAKHLAVAAAIPVVAFALFRAFEPRRPAAPEPAASEAAASQATAAPEHRLQIRAGFERERHGHLWLVFLAQVRTEGPPPGGELSLRLRDETGTAIFNHSVSARSARDREYDSGDQSSTLRSLDGRVSLGGLFLEGGERLTLEGHWQGFESAPSVLEVPAPRPFR
jgi:hypothetical protein